MSDVIRPINTKRQPGPRALELADTLEAIARDCREGKIYGGGYAIVYHDPSQGHRSEFGNIHDEHKMTIIGALQCLVVMMSLE